MIKKTISIILLVFGFFASQAQYTFEHIYKSPLNQFTGNFVEANNGDIVFPIYTVNPFETKIVKINLQGVIIDSVIIKKLPNAFIKMIKYDDNSFFISGCLLGDTNDVFCLRKYDFNFNLLNEIVLPVEGKLDYINYAAMMINSRNNLVVSVLSSKTMSAKTYILEVNQNCEIVKSKILNTAWNYAVTNAIIQKNEYYYFFVNGALMEKTSLLRTYKLDTAFNNLGRIFSGYPDVIEDCNNAKWLNDSVFLLSGRNLNSQTTYEYTQILKIKIDTSFHILKNFTLSQNDSSLTIACEDNLSFIDVNNIFLGSWSVKHFSNDSTNQFILTKLDSSLNVKWTKKYGGDAVYYLDNIKATQDGGCIMNGFSYNDHFPENLYDPFIMKVNSEGNINWVHNLPSTFMKVNVYPNPGSDKLMVNNPPLNTSLVLYNTNGQAVITQSLNQNNSINTISLQSGIYFYQLIDDKGKVLGAGKWVKGKR